MNITDVLMPTHSDLSKLLHTGAAIDPACRALTGGQPDHCRHGIQYATICHECDVERHPNHQIPPPPSPTPEGLRTLAQGCGASPSRAATLGNATNATNPNGVVPPAMLAVLTLVIGERLRQNRLTELEILPFNCADPKIPGAEKLMILGEEFGEVSTALYELRLSQSYARGETPEADLIESLRTELIQVAAVAVAWAESLTTQP